MRIDVEIPDPRFFAEDAQRAQGLIRRGLEWVGQELSSAVTRNAPWKSGRLRSSIHPTGELTETNDGYELRVGIMQAEDATVLKYARIRDVGGTIRAKTSKGLFFPVSGAAFTAAGVGGMSYGQAKSAGLAAGTEWRRVMSVTQRGNRYLTGTAETEAPRLIDKYVGMSLRDL